MDDFRLKVFVSAAHNLSFTKCAREMYISQPAVSKNITELEQQFKTPLFERNGSRLLLTEAGQRLLVHAEHLLEKYNAMVYEMSLLTNDMLGELRIGASTTIAQYFLPPILAQLTSLFPGIKITVLSGNSTQIEGALIAHKIDIGLVENESRNQSLKYETIMNDELVLVSDTSRKYAEIEELEMDELTHIPLILRENGSGTLEVIERTFADRDLPLNKFNVVMQLGSTEAIKLFIHNADVLAIVSVIAIRKELRERSLKIIDIHNVDMIRQFAFVTRQGEQNNLVNTFCEFVKRHRNNF